MSLLNIFFIVSAIIIILFSFDIAKRQKFNALHFVVFFVIWFWLLVFTIFPHVLDVIWRVFWLQRWADLLVYSSLIFLVYFVLLLLNKIEWIKTEFTILVRELAIFNSCKKILNWKYAFIVPAYNEAKVIWKTISWLIDAWEKNIIVINDWSKDNTLEVLKPFEENIVILTHLKNRWQWAWIETWFEYIRRYWNVDFIVTYDSDWQHDLKDLKNFEKAILENPKAKIFLWSRFKWEAKNITLSRKIILKLWILFTFFISKIKLTDAHNWYRVIKKEALNDIKITLDGMWHASEIVDIIAEKNIPFVEVPVVIKYDEYSMAKWQKSSNALNIAFKMIWSKFFR